MTKQIIGTVVSTKMVNTIVIKVERKYRHPLYRKVITRHKKYKAHNEIEGIQEGDVVMIQETRPISKEVSYVVVGKTKAINS
jgi:small subunit ribosomal protein S17